MADEIIKKQITKEGYDELQNELSERRHPREARLLRESKTLRLRATFQRTLSTMKRELNRQRTRHVSKSSKQSSSLLKLLTIPTFPQIRFLSVQR
jgi:hypothetical protein